MRRLWWLLAILSVALGASRAAHAQETLGPPAWSPDALSSLGSTQLGTGVDPLSVLAEAARALPMSGAAAGQGGGGGGAGAAESSPGFSSALSVVLVLTVITLAPSIILMTTCFVRVLIVLSLLRQALGTQTLPPPQVILSLSLFVTAMVMAPTVDRIRVEAIEPFQRGEVATYDELWIRASGPLRDFMFDQIEATGNWSSLYTMLNYRGIDTSDPTSMRRGDVPTACLIPAFMLSELKTAFLMGFRVYVPFLVIDMVISAVLIAMGMMMLPPVLISLPFKLLLFVLVDGWQLVVSSLLTSFAVDGASALAQPALLDAAMAAARDGWQAWRGLAAVA